MQWWTPEKLLLQISIYEPRYFQICQFILFQINLYFQNLGYYLERVKLYLSEQLFTICVYIKAALYIFLPFYMYMYGIVFLCNLFI